jgi:hypothetical protein
MGFSDIPVRSNGQRLTRDMLNALRTAGIALETLLGTARVVGSQAIANNQVVAANVTDLLFDYTTTRRVVVDWWCRRKSDSVDLIESGTFVLLYKPGSTTWDFFPVSQEGDDSGLTWSVTAAGQAKYASTNVAGVYDTTLSKVAYSARTLGV